MKVTRFTSSLKVIVRVKHFTFGWTKFNYCIPGYFVYLPIHFREMLGDIKS